MFCSGLSVISNITFMIGAVVFNGSIYQDDKHHLSAIKVDSAHDSYTILSNPYYSKCFEYTNPLLIKDIKMPWIPNEPLEEWSRDELEDELVECKTKLRLLRHHYLVDRLTKMPTPPSRRPTVSPAYHTADRLTMHPTVGHRPHKQDKRHEVKHKH
jgi:hypothetical protein